MSTPSLLRLRYPAFAAVPDATIAYWLTDAARIVTASWGDDYEPALLALAAHSMSTNGTPGIAGAGIPAGVRRFRSASADVEMTDAAANRSLSGSWDATIYGQEFAVMLRRNTGGPFLAGFVEPRCDLWGVL